MKKKRISTEVSENTKTQWDDFMLSKHGTIKGPYGPELELAMKNHMKNYVQVSVDDSIQYGKSTMESLKSICFGLRELPSFPMIQPITLTTIIKKYTQIKDVRTIKKYKKIILSYSKQEKLENQTFPQLNVEGFCVYVEKLTQEKFVNV
ncbi:MAG: hypothetical protein HRU07_05730 [Nitrosopumilus sp.]|nr:hypothetical protein [Nitrosopumilus sp.]NRA05646.1 hypothetical protein [Nitrosopumilus sp.]